MTAVMLESFTNATEAPPVASLDGRFCRSALAPASSPSAMIEGISDALSLIEEPTFFTRPVMPPDSGSVMLAFASLPTLDDWPMPELPKLVWSPPVF